MSYYEQYMGTFYQKDSRTSSLIWAGDEVAVCYDANPEAPCLLKHGDPKSVEEYAQGARQLFASKRLNHFIKDITVVTSRHWDVEELNRCLSTSGYILYMIENLAKREKETPVFEIVNGGTDLVFSQPIEELKIPITGWSRKHKKAAERKKCVVTIRSRPYKSYGKGPEGRFDDVLHLDGGSTGFEGFCIDPRSLDMAHVPYWSACAGGSGYPEFRVAKDQMRKVFDEYLKTRRLQVTVSLSEDQWKAEVIDITGHPEGNWVVLAPVA